MTVSLRFLGLIILLLTGLYACKPDDETVTNSPGQALTFDLDTITFDTVFTTQRTATRRLRVYNPNDEAIVLEQVSMAKAGTAYTFYVNGRPGPVASGIEILGNDSALVLISAVLPTSGEDTAMFTQDAIVIRVKGRSEAQAVPVIAYGQDAIYYNNEEIPCGTRWTKGKPIGLLGSVLVPKNCTLTVEAGTRIHSYKGTFIIVEGTLIVKGSQREPVVFTGNRLEPYYALVPEQWGYIFFAEGSQGDIDYARIENGLRGIQVRLPSNSQPATLRLTNTVIRNHSDVGLYCFNAKVTALNCVFADCGTANVACQVGGDYNFIHCTSAYSGNTPFNRRTPSVVFADYFEISDSQKVYTAAFSTLNFINSVVTGGEDEELALADPRMSTPIPTMGLLNNVITSRSRKWNTIGTANQSVVGAVSFYKPFEYSFQPDSLGSSPLKGKALRLSQIPGLPALDQFLLQKDILGKDRPDLTEAVTVGAYQQF